MNFIQFERMADRNIFQINKSASHHQRGGLAKTDQMVGAFVRNGVHPRAACRCPAVHQFVVDQAFEPPIENSAAVFVRLCCINSTTVGGKYGVRGEWSAKGTCREVTTDRFHPSGNACPYTFADRTSLAFHDF